MTEKTSVRLLDRLRLEGIIPPDADCVLERLRPPPEDHSRGAWKWHACWGYDGSLTEEAGSSFPMALCADADRLEVTEPEWRVHSIFPVNDASIRDL